MSDYNHVGISGRLTRDAELKSVGDQSLLEFGLASNRKFKDKEKTVFVDVTLWGKQAETLEPYLKKGKHVVVGGRLEFSTWGEGDSKRSKLTINADTVDMTPKNSGDYTESDSSSTVTSVKTNTGLPSEEMMADVPF